MSDDVEETPQSIEDGPTIPEVNEATWRALFEAADQVREAKP